MPRRGVPGFFRRPFDRRGASVSGRPAKRRFAFASGSVVAGFGGAVVDTAAKVRLKSSASLIAVESGSAIETPVDCKSSFNAK